MLESLKVKNVALIDESEVTFGEGLNILTGETGAGQVDPDRFDQSGTRREGRQQSDPSRGGICVCGVVFSSK